MNKELSTKDSELVLKKMCEFANVDYEKVDWTDREWFLQNTWTTEQEKDFINWLARFLIDNNYVRPRWKQAIHEAEKIDMQYGWKTMPNYIDN